MIKHVSSRHAEVVRVRRGEVLEVPADLVDKLKANLAVRRPAANRAVNLAFALLLLLSVLAALLL